MVNITIKHNLWKTSLQGVVAWRQLVESIALCFSPFDNIERICLAVIALAEWLALADVIFTSVICGEDHSRSGQPFMISPSSDWALMTSNLESSPGLKKLFLWIQTRSETTLAWVSKCFSQHSTRSLNNGSSCVWETPGGRNNAQLLQCTNTDNHNPPKTISRTVYSVLVTRIQRRWNSLKVCFKYSYLKTARFHGRNKFRVPLNTRAVPCASYLRMYPGCL